MKPVHFQRETKLILNVIEVTASQQRDAEIHQMRVVGMTDISPTVKKLVLHTDVRPVPFAFKAGQWYFQISIQIIENSF